MLLHTIQVLGYPVALELVPDLCDERGRQLDGLAVLSPPYAIRLHADLAREAWPETILHELLHVLAAVYGRRLGEAAVRDYSLGLHQALSGLVEWRLPG